MTAQKSSDGAKPPGERGILRYERAPSTVAEVMIAPVALARPGTPLLDAVQLMQRSGLPYLIIDMLPFSPRCGLLTLLEAQLRLGHANGSAGGLSARDAMVVPPFVAAPAMRLEDCATLMLSSDTRRVIVMEAGRPVGVVCDSDIFQAIEARG